MYSENTFLISREIVAIIISIKYRVSSHSVKDQRLRFISHNKTILLLARIKKFLPGIRIIKGEYAKGLFMNLCGR